MRTSGFATATRQSSDQHYVTITVDDPRQKPGDDRVDALANAYRVAQALRESMAEVAGAHAGRATAPGGRYVAEDQGIRVRQPGWAVAGRNDLQATRTYASYTEAAGALDEDQDRADRRVVGAHEVAA